MTYAHRVSGYAGLIPFFTLMILAISGYDAAGQWLLSYAALIFSFLGGVLWLATIKDPLPRHVTVISLVVMLWGWLWLIIPSEYWLIIAALSFLLLHGYERYFLAHSYFPDFMHLRRNLSAGAAIALTLAYLFLP